MRFKIDKNFCHIANLAGKVPSEAGIVLGKLMTKAGVLDDDYLEGYGKTFNEAKSEDCETAQIIWALEQLGIKYMTTDDLEILEACIVMGDYNCPICGGKLKDESYEERIYGGYYEEDYVTTYVKYVCPLCGYEKSYTEH